MLFRYPPIFAVSGVPVAAVNGEQAARGGLAGPRNKVACAPGPPATRPPRATRGSDHVDGSLGAFGHSQQGPGRWWGSSPEHAGKRFDVNFKRGSHVEGFAKTTGERTPMKTMPRERLLARPEVAQGDRGRGGACGRGGRRWSADRACGHERGRRCRVPVMSRSIWATRLALVGSAFLPVCRGARARRLLPRHPGAATCLTPCIAEVPPGVSVLHATGDARGGDPPGPLTCPPGDVRSKPSRSSRGVLIPHPTPATTANALPSAAIFSAARPGDDAAAAREIEGEHVALRQGDRRHGAASGRAPLRLVVAHGEHLEAGDLARRGRGGGS